MFFCSAVLAAQHALLTVQCYMFLSFIVCGILQLCESLRDTMVPPEASLQEQDGSKSTTQYIHVQNVAVGLPRNTCAFSNFLQLEYCYSTYLMYNVQLHTTYIQTPLAFNTLMWGSLRLTPITGNVLVSYQTVHSLYCKNVTVTSRCYIHFVLRASFAGSLVS